MDYEVIDREKRGGKLFTAPGVKIGRRVSIDTSGNVELLGGVTVGEDVLILTHEHEDGMHQSQDAVNVYPKKIHRDVFIGPRAIVLPKCQFVGEGAIIGAGAVVGSNVPPGAVIKGNPGVIVRYVK